MGGVKTMKDNSNGLDMAGIKRIIPEKKLQPIGAKGPRATAVTPAMLAAIPKNLPWPKRNAAIKSYFAAAIKQAAPKNAEQAYMTVSMNGQVASGTRKPFSIDQLDTGFTPTSDLKTGNATTQAQKDKQKAAKADQEKQSSGPINGDFLSKPAPDKKIPKAGPLGPVGDFSGHARAKDVSKEIV